MKGIWPKKIIFDKEMKFFLLVSFPAFLLPNPIDNTGPGVLKEKFFSVDILQSGGSSHTQRHSGLFLKPTDLTSPMVTM